MNPDSPRKRKVTEDTAGGSGEGKDEDNDESPADDPVKLLLPVENVERIMMKFLPGDAQFSEGSKEAVTECASEFISFVTDEAADKCKEDGRKVLIGEDVLHSLKSLGFHDYIAPLKLYLQKYREMGEVPDPLFKVPRLRFPYGQSSHPQGRASFPQSRASLPQSRASFPQGQGLFHQGQGSSSQGQGSVPQDQGSSSQGSGSFPPIEDSFFEDLDFFI